MEGDNIRCSNHSKNFDVVAVISKVFDELLIAVMGKAG